MTQHPNTETAVRFTNLICDLSHMVGVTVVLPAANDDLPEWVA
jgi:hypothetical protein